MKKIFFSLLAIGAIASCAKTEPVYMDGDSEIKVKPTTSIATKANVLAAIDGTEYPTAENFDVYAYWKDVEAGSTFTDGYTPYLTGTTTGVEFMNKGNYWGGVTTYYWPKNGSLRFAAYSPAAVNMTHDLAKDTYTVEDYVQPNETAKTWDLLVAPTSPSYTAMTAAENVSVVFEHALSWITIQVKAKDAEAAKAFDVTKVTINDVVTTGTLNADMDCPGTTADRMNWTLTNVTAPYVVYTGSKVVTETATVIETTTAGTLVLPQATTSITVDYTQKALEGTPALEGQSVTVDLVLDTDNTPWVAGKHYIYTLVFGLDEILINPSVVDWEDVQVGEVDTDKTAVNVSTAEQLVAAIAENAKVVLQNDIKLSEILTINENNVVLDGNGFTLTSSAGRAINVDGDVVATIKNLTIDCSGERAINIINGAAKVTVDNVTATCSNYAVNIATSASNVSLGVSNSDLTGLNVVNVAGENAHVELYNTKLTCDDQNAGENYGAISFYTTALYSKVIVRECNIVVNGDSCAGVESAYGATIEMDEKTTGNRDIQKFPFAVIYPATENAYVCTTFAEALATAQDGETITLTQDVTETCVVEGKKVTVDLNGHTITGKLFAESAGAMNEGNTDSYGFWVKDGAELTITGNGAVKTQDCDYSIAVWAQGGKVTIENGTFENAGEGSDLVYASANGHVVIKDGKFVACEKQAGVDGTLEAYSALNLKGDGTNSSITVYGGSYYKFDPANNKSENPAISFVAAGYKSVANGDYYDVVKE